MEVEKLISIFNERNEFLTLSDIYDEYSMRYDVTSYTDFKAAIRTEIYRNCLNRDLNTSKNYIFVSAYEKNTKGQKYGLLSWLSNKSDKN